MKKVKHVIILFEDGGFAIASHKLIAMIEEELS